MVRRLILAAIMAATALPTPARIDTVQVIGRDDGGQIGKYMRRIEAAALMGQEVQIAGECASACTMWLQTACVWPEAKLGFHGAADASGARLNAGDRWSTTIIIASHYPPAIADWFIRGPANGSKLIWISGATAIKMGAKECQ